MGFTVSLLIGELVFATDPERSEHVTMAVLFGSLLAARIAGVLLRMRHRAYVRMREDEQDLDSASTERLAFGKET